MWSHLLWLPLILCFAPVCLCAHPCLIVSDPPGQDLWSYQLHQGKFAVEKYYNITIPSIVAQYTEVDLIRDAINGGCTLIFAGSPLYAAVVNNLTREYPALPFVVIGGSTYRGRVSVGSGRIYQARFLEGIMAGYMTKTNQLGFVNSFVFEQSRQHINGFYLGMKQANPKATLYLISVGSFSDPEKAEESVRALKGKNVDYVAVFQDDAFAQKEASRLKIYSGGFHTDFAAYGVDAGDKVLTSVVWKWINMFEYFINKTDENNFLAEYYWPGIPQDAVELSPFHPDVTLEARTAVNQNTEDLRTGTIGVFCGAAIQPYNPTDPSGCLAETQIASMDFLFDEIINLGLIAAYNPGGSDELPIAAIVVPIAVVAGLVIFLCLLFGILMFIYRIKALPKQKKSKIKKDSLITFVLDDLEEDTDESPKRNLGELMERSSTLRLLIVNPKFCQYMLSLSKKLDNNSKCSSRSKLLIKSVLVLNHIHHGSCRKLISYMLIQDIKMSTDLSDLFRDSISANVFSVQSKLLGMQYLRNVLVPTLEELLDRSDMNKLPPNQTHDLRKMEAGEVEYENRLQLLLTSQKLFVAITKSVKDVPREIRGVCKDLKEELVKDRYKGQNVDYHVIISSLMFLRFINPALVSPGSYGLVEEHDIQADVNNFLLLLSKVLQNVANQTRFEKEEYMQRLNEFIEENGKSVNKWIDSIVNLDGNEEVYKDVKYEARVKKLEKKAAGLVVKFVDENRETILHELKTNLKYSDLVQDYKNVLVDLKGDTDDDSTTSDSGPSDDEKNPDAIFMDLHV